MDNCVDGRFLSVTSERFCHRFASDDRIARCRSSVSRQESRSTDIHNDNFAIYGLTGENIQFLLPGGHIQAAIQLERRAIRISIVLNASALELHAHRRADIGYHYDCDDISTGRRQLASAMRRSLTLRIAVTTTTPSATTNSRPFLVQHTRRDNPRSHNHEYTPDQTAQRTGISGR